MGGPSAGVELRRPLSQGELADVQSMIDSISSHRLAEDFWINNTAPIGGHYSGEDQPFALCFSRTSESFDEDDAERYEHQIDGTFGYRPVQSVDWVAMCNGDHNHQVLGELCLWTAERFDGVIGFGGPLLPALPEHLRGRRMCERLAWDEVRPLHHQMVGGMPGRIIEHLYRTANDTTWAFHTADVEFMRAWLTHPEFHMIK